MFLKRIVPFRSTDTLSKRSKKQLPFQEGAVFLGGLSILLIAVHFFMEMIPETVSVLTEQSHDVIQNGGVLIFYGIDDGTVGQE